MTTELSATIGALVAEIALLVFFFMQGRKKPVPGRVRVFPYTAATVVMMLLILMTTAHLISLLTGTQLTPKRPKGMR